MVLDGCVVGLVYARRHDGLTQQSSSSHQLIINATDACGLPANHSTQLIIHTRPADLPAAFTATLYTFNITRADFTRPSHVIGRLHMLTGITVFSTVGPIYKISYDLSYDYLIYS